MKRLRRHLAPSDPSQATGSLGNSDSEADLNGKDSLMSVRGHQSFTPSSRRKPSARERFDNNNRTSRKTLDSRYDHLPVPFSRRAQYKKPLFTSTLATQNRCCLIIDSIREKSANAEILTTL